MKYIRWLAVIFLLVPISALAFFQTGPGTDP